jgi:L-2,4-diaminobutyric acid acetyltransferase
LNPDKTPAAGTVRIRRPRTDDGPAIYRLVRDSGMLALNSPYAYLIMATHFRETSVVVEKAGALAGFLIGYRLPERPRTAFVWQIGIAESMRGKGIGKKLLRHMVDRLDGEIDYLEATTPRSNRASRRLFRSFAAERGVPFSVQPGFEPALFVPPAGEPEELMRLGPFPR